MYNRILFQTFFFMFCPIRDGFCYCFMFSYCLNYNWEVSFYLMFVLGKKYQAFSFGQNMVQEFCPVRNGHPEVVQDSK